MWQNPSSQHSVQNQSSHSVQNTSQHSVQNASQPASANTSGAAVVTQHQKIQATQVDQSSSAGVTNVAVSQRTTSANQTTSAPTVLIAGDETQAVQTRVSPPSGSVPVSQNSSSAALNQNVSTQQDQIPIVTSSVPVTSALGTSAGQNVSLSTSSYSQVLTGQSPLSPRKSEIQSTESKPSVITVTTQSPQHVSASVSAKVPIPEAQSTPNKSRKVDGRRPDLANLELALIEKLHGNRKDKPAGFQLPSQLTTPREGLVQTTGDVAFSTQLTSDTMLQQQVSGIQSTSTTPSMVQADPISSQSSQLQTVTSSQQLSHNLDESQQPAVTATKQTGQPDSEVLPSTNNAVVGEELTSKKTSENENNGGDECFTTAESDTTKQVNISTATSTTTAVKTPVPVTKQRSRFSVTVVEEDDVTPVSEQDVPVSQVTSVVSSEEIVTTSVGSNPPTPRAGIQRQESRKGRFQITTMCDDVTQGTAQAETAEAATEASVTSPDADATVAAENSVPISDVTTASASSPSFATVDCLTTTASSTTINVSNANVVAQAVTVTKGQQQQASSAVPITAAVSNAAAASGTNIGFTPSPNTLVTYPSTVVVVGSAPAPALVTGSANQVQFGGLDNQEQEYYHMPKQHQQDVKTVQERPPKFDADHVSRAQQPTIGTTDELSHRPHGLPLSSKIQTTDPRLPSPHESDNAAHQLNQLTQALPNHGLPLQGFPPTPLPSHLGPMHATTLSSSFPSISGTAPISNVMQPYPATAAAIPALIPSGAMNLTLGGHIPQQFNVNPHLVPTEEYADMVHDVGAGTSGPDHRHQQTNASSSSSSSSHAHSQVSTATAPEPSTVGVKRSHSAKERTKPACLADMQNSPSSGTPQTSPKPQRKAEASSQSHAVQQQQPPVAVAPRPAVSSDVMLGQNAAQSGVLPMQHGPYMFPAAAPPVPFINPVVFPGQQMVTPYQQVAHMPPYVQQASGYPLGPAQLPFLYPGQAWSGWGLPMNATQQAAGHQATAVSGNPPLSAPAEIPLQQTRSRESSSSTSVNMK